MQMLATIKKISVFLYLAGFLIIAFMGFWYYRDVIFPNEMIAVELSGPRTLHAGEEAIYEVTFRNNSAIALERPKIVFELPEHSLSEEGKTRVSQDLDDIPPKGSGNATFRGNLIGREGDIKVARVWLSYIPHNLSIRYEADDELRTAIMSVPITLEYNAPLYAEKGREISYTISYASEIDYPLENASIKIEEINGFNVTSGTPLSLDNAEWKLGTLQKGQKGEVVIKGIVGNNAGSTINFKARIGIWQSGNFIPLKEISHDVEVREPSVIITQTINGSDNYNPNFGEELHYEIYVKNTGSTAVNNATISLRLTGQAFDFGTLILHGGEAKLGNSLIVFNQDNISTLRQINPNDTVKVEFTIKLKDSSAISGGGSMVIKNKVEALGITQEFSSQVNSLPST